MGFVGRWCLAVALLYGCGTDDSGPLDSITPPACNSIQHFGNSAACDQDGPKLESCGASASRTCASGWLCFDAPQFDDCTCSADADCAGRQQYINDARATQKKAPLTSKCQDGRCSGRP